MRAAASETECFSFACAITSSAIRNAEHYVYIENQFFVTSSLDPGLPSLVQNRIGHALVERILRAHSEGSTFRVIVVLPLMPAFRGTQAAC